MQIPFSLFVVVVVEFGLCLGLRNNHPIIPSSQLSLTHQCKPIHTYIKPIHTYIKPIHTYVGTGVDDTALKFIASKRLDGKEDYHFAPTAAQLEGLVKDMATETCTVCGVRCTVYGVRS